MSGGTSLPSGSQNRVKGHFLQSENEFLKAYGKRPITSEGFFTFIEAFKDISGEVGLDVLTECAKLEVAHVRGENSGSSQKLRRPELWLTDGGYQDWLPEAEKRVNARARQPKLTPSISKDLEELDNL